MPDGGDAPQRFGRVRGWVRRLLGNATPDDLYASRQHSRDFDQVRAHFVYRRVRLLAFALAAAALLWVPVDWLSLAPAQARDFFTLRLAFSGAFLGLALWGQRPHSVRLMRLRLALLMAIPALFYVASRVVLGGGVPSDGLVVGYSFLPFLMAALIGIFPLTFKEGGAYAAVLLTAVVASDLAYGTLLTVPGLRDIWLLALLLVVAFWGQLSQLDMLLRLHREATRDALTGLVNRRVIVRRLEREVAAAHQAGDTLSVLLFDLDLFKRVNDTYGHLMGDRVLTAFAEVLRAQLPETAVAGRYGGEEFITLLPGRRGVEAEALADSIRHAWAETTLTGPDGESLRFSTSIGVSELRPEDSAETLVGRVDDRLYQAKEAGRNLVVRAT